MAKPTASSLLLAAVSGAQLATGGAGMVVALRRRHPYDVFWMRGRAETIARDAIFRGTALSAPVSNLLIQAAVTALVREARFETIEVIPDLAGLDRVVAARRGQTP